MIALHETRGRLWAGTRSGHLGIVDGAFHLVAALPGAVLGLTHLRGMCVASTASGALHAFGDDGAPLWTSQAHNDWAWCVTHCRGGLVSVGHDGRVCFTSAGGETRTLAEFGEPLRAVAAEDDVLWLGDVHGSLHRLERQERVLSVEAHDAAITSIAIAPDGAVVTGSEDGLVKRWRGGVLERCAQSQDFVTSVALSSKGELICAGYEGDVFRA